MFFQECDAIRNGTWAMDRDNTWYYQLMGDHDLIVSAWQQLNGDRFPTLKEARQFIDAHIAGLSHHERVAKQGKRV
jgi:hypothetical protein